MTLEIPPLRARRAHIPALAVELLAQAAAAAGVAAPPMSADATAALVAHSWPGNVRELRNVVERARVLSQDGEIRREHLLFDTPSREAEAEDSKERDRIVAALEACSGNQTSAAQMLGVSRSTLVNKLALYRLPRPRK